MVLLHVLGRLLSTSFTCLSFFSKSIDQMTDDTAALYLVDLAHLHANRSLPSINFFHVSAPICGVATLEDDVVGQLSPQSITSLIGRLVWLWATQCLLFEREALFVRVYAIAIAMSYSLHGRRSSGHFLTMSIVCLTFSFCCSFPKLNAHPVPDSLVGSTPARSLSVACPSTQMFSFLSPGFATGLSQRPCLC